MSSTLVIPSLMAQSFMRRALERGSHRLECRAGIAYWSGCWRYLASSSTSEVLPHKVLLTTEMEEGADYDLLALFDLKKEHVHAFEASRGHLHTIQVKIVGTRLDPIRTIGEVEKLDLSRLIGALGGETARRIADSRFAVIGCGGLGSMMVDGLARAGAQNLILVDEDKVEASNLNRMVNCFPEDIGRPKVDAISSSAGRVSGSMPKAVNQPFGSVATRLDLRDLDLMIVTTDSVESRRACGRFCSDFHIPCLSVGTGIFEDAMGLEAGLALPGEACLACLLGLPEGGRFEFGRERLGSLASLNFAAAGIGLRLVEDFAAGKVPQSASHRWLWMNGLVASVGPRKRFGCDCATRSGVGDYGLTAGRS